MENVKLIYFKKKITEIFFAIFGRNLRTSDSVSNYSNFNFLFNENVFKWCFVSKIVLVIEKRFCKFKLFRRPNIFQKLRDQFIRIVKAKVRTILETEYFSTCH